MNNNTLEITLRSIVAIEKVIQPKLIWKEAIWKRFKN
jgi:hypothetical protein